MEQQISKADSSALAKVNIDCSLADLQGPNYIFVQNDESIARIASQHGCDPDEVSGVVVKVGDDDFKEVWIAGCSRPFQLDACYTRIA